MIFALLATLFGVAQEGIVVFEGAEAYYNVEKHTGSNYHWEVYKDFNPDIIADPSEYEFTTRSDSNAVGVQWKLAGLYYLKVSEFDLESCSNVKALAVQVIENNRSIEFELLTSSSCYNFNDNSFEQSLVVLNNEGLPLASLYFPLEVGFIVNSHNYSQMLEFDNQTLQIKNEWLDLPGDRDTNIVVELTTVTDKLNLPIKPFVGKNIHTSTIFGTPLLEFTSTYTQVEQGFSLEHLVQLNYGQAIGAEYTWNVSPAEGTSTNLSAMKTNAATILWDGPPGNYTLSVAVTDGNGCISEVLSKTIEITESIDESDLIFAPEYLNTIICSDLGNGQEGSVPAHSQSIFQVKYYGNKNLISTRVTIQNPNGIFIDLDGNELPNQQNPKIEISNPETDKTIEFSITDSWLNNSAQNELFIVKLVDATLEGSVDLIAQEEYDIERNITVLPIPDIDFK